jgi:predicted nucleotidyltransferase
MRREEAILLLSRSRERLRALGVGELYLYGSVARDQADANSDVDLLIEPADARFSIFSLGNVQDAVSEILGAPAEVHDYGGYQRLPEFRQRVGDLVRVF